MKHNKHTQIQKSAVASQLATAAGLSQNEIDFVPSPDEVARRAYFSYVNQGSSSGHEVQHWLVAEAELIAERNLTRVHGFHNQT
jgi:elongation factor P hydroxylase